MDGRGVKELWLGMKWQGMERTGLKCCTCCYFDSWEYIVGSGLLRSHVASFFFFLHHYFCELVALKILSSCWSAASELRCGCICRIDEYFIVEPTASHSTSHDQIKAHLAHPLVMTNTWSMGVKMEEGKASSLFMYGKVEEVKRGRDSEVYCIAS